MVWTLALLAIGTPSSTNEVRKAAMSAALGPPTVMDADELVGTLRGAKVWAASRPGAALDDRGLPHDSVRR